jgi:hypothetical protein
VSDIEIDVAHGMEAAVTPADPPESEDRAGAFSVDGFGQRRP